MSKELKCTNYKVTLSSFHLMRYLSFIFTAGDN